MWAQLSGGEVDRIITHPEILKIGGVTYPRQIFTDVKKLKSLNIHSVFAPESPVAVLR